MTTNNSVNYQPVQHSVLVGGVNGNITSVTPTANTSWVLTSNGTGSDPSFQVIPTPSGSFTSINTQVFTYTGSTQTYTPTANMAYCIVMICAGGGGGGGISAANGATGGGGGGEYAEGFFSSSTIGSSQTVTIGNGGTSGSSSGTDGGTGGTTSFGSLLTAIGGGGSLGSAGSSTFVGAGGTGGTGGYLHVQGSAGLPPGNYVAPSGGFVTGGYYTGAGGSSLLSGISQSFPTSGSSSATVKNGQLYGGGGCGVASPSTGSGGVAGGTGAPGICIVIEYIT